MPKFLDLTGETFGRLTVLSREGKAWLCLCLCGVQKVVAAASLRSGATKSCGCLNRDTTRRRNTENNPSSTKPKRDLTGVRFGRLVVVKYVHRPGSKSHWLCQCDCGNRHSTSGANLKRNLVRSCGCSKRGGATEKRAGRGRKYMPEVPLHPRAHDLSGQIFGKLTAVHFCGSARWYCTCQCGSSTVSLAQNLRSGVSRSCGCGQRASVVARNIRGRGRGSRMFRAAVLGSGIRITAELWSIICVAWGERCAYCTRPAKLLQVEHVHALALGGKHVLGNIVPGCHACNGTKGALPLDVALKRLGSQNFHQRRLAAIVKIQEMLHA